MAGQLDLRSNGRSNSNVDHGNGFLGVDSIGLDTSYDKIEHLTPNVRGGQPPHMGRSTPIFFYESKDITKGWLHAKIQRSSSKTVDLHPILSFSYLWPVNAICGQTKGQILISIAEMDSLGSIT